MKKFTVAALAALGLAATPALAQAQFQPVSAPVTAENELGGEGGNAGLLAAIAGFLIVGVIIVIADDDDDDIAISV